MNNFQKYLLHVDSSRCTCMKHKFVCHFEILSRTSYFCWILSHTCLFWVLTSHISDKNINYNYSIQNIILLLHNFSLKKIFLQKKKKCFLGKNVQILPSGLESFSKPKFLTNWSGGRLWRWKQSHIIMRMSVQSFSIIIKQILCSGWPLHLILPALDMSLNIFSLAISQERHAF